MLFVMQSSPQSTFFLRSVIIWINDLVVVLMIFGNLMYYTHFKTETEEPEAVRASIGQAVQRFAEKSQHIRANRLTPSPKGSQTSGSTSKTPPGVVSRPSQSMVSEVDEVERPRSQVKEFEIVLTRSELEKNNAGVRRGEFLRRPESVLSTQSSHDAQNTPLPRAMMNSSVSTVVCGNLASREPQRFHSEAESDILSTQSSAVPSAPASSNPYSPTASTASRPFTRSSVLSGVSTASSNRFPSTVSVASIPEHDVASHPGHISALSGADGLEPKNPPKTTYGTNAEKQRKSSGGRRMPWAGLGSMFPSSDSSSKSGLSFVGDGTADTDEIQLNFSPQQHPNSSSLRTYDT